MDGALAGIVAAGGEWLRSLNPSIPTDCTQVLRGNSSYPACWYNSAESHFVDIFVGGLAFLPMIALGFCTQWKVVVPARPHKVSSADVWARKAVEAVSHTSSNGSETPVSDASPRSGANGVWKDASSEEVIANPTLRALVNTLDYVLRVLVCVCMCATIVYKSVVPGRWAFLLMPCHVTNALLALLCFVPRAKASAPSTLLVWNFTLYTWFGTLLALALPDTRNQDMPGELLNFWTQHVVLFALPLVWLVKRRFPVAGGLTAFIFTWGFFGWLQAHIHFAASMITGFNIVYCMVPFKPQARVHGTAFRYWWVFVELPAFIFVTRYVLVELLMWLTGVSRFKVSGQSVTPSVSAGAAPVSSSSATNGATQSLHINAAAVKTARDESGTDADTPVSSAPVSNKSARRSRSPASDSALRKRNVAK